MPSPVSGARGPAPSHRNRSPTSGRRGGHRTCSPTRRRRQAPRRFCNRVAHGEGRPRRRSAARRLGVAEGCTRFSPTGVYQRPGSRRSSVLVAPGGGVLRYPPHAVDAVHEWLPTTACGGGVCSQASNGPVATTDHRRPTGVARSQSPLRVRGTALHTEAAAVACPRTALFPISSTPQKKNFFHGGPIAVRIADSPTRSTAATVHRRTTSTVRRSYTTAGGTVTA